jgi:hypothetical protein
MLLNIQMEGGISTNRGRYSLPQDVLEPDCCDGNNRLGMVVLGLAVGGFPQSL